MKRNIFLITGFLFIISCNTGGSGSSSSSVSFIDQVLSGTHTNLSWTLVSGSVEVDYFEPEDWYFEMYNIEPREGYEPYESFAYSGLSYKKIMFLLPGDPATGLPKIGRTDLYINTNTSDLQSCTFYDTDDSLNTIATSGAIEILSVETGVNASVTGRMHVWYDNSGEYEVNGNFTLPINPADLP